MCLTTPIYIHTSQIRVPMGQLIVWVWWWFRGTVPRNMVMPRVCICVTSLSVHHGPGWTQYPARPRCVHTVPSVTLLWSSPAQQDLGHTHTSSGAVRRHVIQYSIVSHDQAENRARDTTPLRVTWPHTEFCTWHNTSSCHMTTHRILHVIQHLFVSHDHKYIPSRDTVFHRVTWPQIYFFTWHSIPPHHMTPEP